MRACFPNSIRVLDYAIGKRERMEDVAFGRCWEVQKHGERLFTIII
jgi:hypothetical protein